MNINIYRTSTPSHNRGAAVITAVLLFVIISTVIAIGLSSPVAREYVTTRDFEKSKGAYYLSESGQEDAIYRIKKLLPISTQEVLSLGGNTATTTVISVSAVKKTLESIGDISQDTRHVNSTVTTAIGASFVYGVWAGAGGVSMRDSSFITGNLFSAGPVCGDGSTGSTCSSWDSAQTHGASLITGAVISGGTTGSNGTIARIKNQSGNSMYAGTIMNSSISGSTYCNTISGSSTSTCQALSPQMPSELPISAQDIADLETAAAAGGTVTCTNGSYTLSSTVNFGPKKVPCNLKISGVDAGAGPTITLQGPIWVTGDIDIKDNLTVRVDPIFSGQSIVMISDDPSDRVVSSKIQVENNNSIFVGAPGGNSWIMLLSENMDASQGGNNDAVEVKDGAQGDVLLYSRLGNIKLKNDSAVTNVTGYKIKLENNANVTYTTGLQNALFTSGPGGAWAVTDWKGGQ